jgi:hypothetical protein
LDQPHKEVRQNPPEFEGHGGRAFRPFEAGSEPWNEDRQFYSLAIETLTGTSDPSTIEPVVARLAARGMLLEALCDPALNRTQALALARDAIRIDPTADAALARGLADSQTGQGTVVIKDATRLMGVLCEVGDASRMMTSMLRLLRHPDPYMRSRAVKMVGRGSKSPKWVRQRLNDADPRMRANAIESLWSLDTAAARGLLCFAAREDPHQRVTANALLGLYYLGETSALAELARMAANAAGPVRASAAWAMGESGDVRFQNALRRMLNDEDRTVRKRALSGLARAKALQPAAGSPWHISARVSEMEQNGWRRAVVAIGGDNSGELPAIPSLGFILSEAGSPVMSYRVIRRNPPPPISVAFILPQGAEAAGPLREGIESCLKWKRSRDLWCLLPYADSVDSGMTDAPVDAGGPAFSADADFLKKALAEPAHLECGDLWNTVRRAAKVEGHAALGTRHIILLGTAEESRAAGPVVRAKLRNPHIRLQAIAVGGNPLVLEFCKEVGAHFELADLAGLGATIRRAYLSLLARYEISYQSAVANATDLKLRVQGPGGSGELIVPYSPESRMGRPGRG